MSEPLRILSIGAGAIGTYIGGSLALDGHEVMFLERPEVAQKLRTDGLALGLSDGEKRIQDPRMVESMEAALDGGGFDIALFALKSFDTPGFLASLNVSGDQLPPFLCLSNGVTNEPAISDALGPDKVIAGTVTSSIGWRGAGDIVLERLRGTGVALPDHDGREAMRPLCERLVEAMTAAGLNAILFDSAADMKWSKLLTNLVANASSAILDMPPAEIFAHKGLYRLEITQLREAQRIMTARGIRVVDLPGIPVVRLSRAVRFLPLAISRMLMARAAGPGRGAKMPSFHLDLHYGRGRSEVDHLNGAVVRAGREIGTPTPVNRLLTEILLALTAGEIPLDHYRGNPEKLIAELG